MYGLDSLEQLRADRSSFFSLLPADVLLILGTHVAAIHALAAHKFNSTENIDTAISWLREQRLIDDRLESVASYVHFATDIDKLRLGTYLTLKRNKELLRCYISHFDFTGLSITAAIYLVLSRLQTPGEGPDLDRLFEFTAERYMACNYAYVAGDTDGCYILCFNIILLATDMYSPHVNVRLDKDGFARNVSFTGRTFPRPFLDAIYDEVASMPHPWRDVL